jgi:hypothetical protein
MTDAEEPEGLVFCDDCKSWVPEDDATCVTESGEWFCEACRDASFEREAKVWESYFGGADAIRRNLAIEKQYREEGILNPDGSWNRDALRKLKH